MQYQQPMFSFPFTTSKEPIFLHPSLCHSAFLSLVRKLHPLRHKVLCPTFLAAPMRRRVDIHWVVYICID